ncbi:MAG: glycine--tRNA ligase subunit beta, partial [Acidobacteria bacterium]|nr:glycine--tRNA ligase subunit beta [Acidobacteriota bacterium]
MKIVEQTSKEFLLEIGVEEIPAWMIPPALADLRRLLTAGLDELGFANERFAPFEMYAT